MSKKTKEEEEYEHILEALIELFKKLFNMLAGVIFWQKNIKNGLLNSKPNSKEKKMH